MSWDIIGIFIILAVTLVLFVIDLLRFDVISLLALLAVTLLGLIPFDQAFSGFSNPAVITVAAVLILSKGLENSGFVPVVGKKLTEIKGGKIVQIALLTGLATLLSTFMNNVGSVALLLPVALYISRKRGIPASSLLMPMAFSAHFGGMITLIGTPTNLIISSFREEVLGEPFRMFDFAPVGLATAITSVLFIALIGWRLIPKRKSQTSMKELFDIKNYVSEVELTEDSKLVGKRLSEINQYTENQINVLSLVRNGEKRMAPAPQTKFQVGDILIVQCETKSLENLVSNANVDLVGSEEIEREDLVTEEMTLVEGVIRKNSPLINSSASKIDLRRRYGINLLAVFRQGTQLNVRLDKISFKEGDVLLLQGHPNIIGEAMSALVILPLAERDLHIGRPKRTAPTLIIFIGAILFAAMGILPVAIAFVAGALAMILFDLISLKEAYESVNWPILIL
ncbi:MAG: SLC13 family permease [Brevefilum sp.]